MESETKHLRIHGHVQGVGYRMWAAQLAQRMGLRGWVRNRSADRSVEAVVTGYTDDVQKFISECYNGPAGAKIDLVHVAEGADEEFKGFEIRDTV